MFAVGVILYAIGWFGMRINHNAIREVNGLDQNRAYGVSAYAKLAGMALMTVSIAVFAWKYLP